MKKDITVKGAVQGVGYRPFVAEKADKYGLRGYVLNSGASVGIHVIGKEADIDAFLSDIQNECPPGAFVLSVEIKDTDSDESYGSFKIIESKELDLSSEIPVFLPDIGICPECMKQMLDENDRRYRYPLISCAVCGPRLSILNTLPYDRYTTTMKDFDMCGSCLDEYNSSFGSRRYAQTISCHECGPQMVFRGFGSDFTKDEAVKTAVDVLKKGGIIGLKGVSGYQLVCLPASDTAGRLRALKGRENKPFAIMFSTVESVREYAVVTEMEEELLKSSARPIVLVIARTPETDVSLRREPFPDEVLKKSRYIGAFLPSAGIHRLLTDELGPLIVTSANRSDEPIIIDDDEFNQTFLDETKERHADGVLYHKRKINMPQDDSVMFVITIKDREYAQFVRRARGFAPLPVIFDKCSDMSENVAINNDNYGDTASESSHCNNFSVLAMGGDLKSSFSLGKRDRILPSQYLGDLEDYKTQKTYERVLSEYQRIFCFRPDIIIKDLHPGYMSSALADKISEAKGVQTYSLQHHFAHTYSVMAENSLAHSIGVSFDGTGYGEDGRIWGGEFLLCDGNKHRRMGHLSYIKLQGGDEAPKNARRVMICYLHDCVKRGLLEDIEIQDSFNDDKLMISALDNSINTFETSSMGRLFDAISALLGIADMNTYEGECAILLEKEANGFCENKMRGKSDSLLNGGPEEYDRLFDGSDFPHFEFRLSHEGDGFIADQSALFADILKCYKDGKYCVGAIAYGFHLALAELIRKGCLLIKEKTNENNISLSGGVFNNRILLSSSAKMLMDEGFDVYWNRLMPLGDGGISTGQAYYGLIFKEAF